MDTLDHLEHSSKPSHIRGRSTERSEPPQWCSAGEERLQAHRLRWAMPTSGQAPSLLLQAVCSRFQAGRECRSEPERTGTCDEGTCVVTGRTDGQVRAVTAKCSSYVCALAARYAPVDSRSVMRSPTGPELRSVIKRDGSAYNRRRPARRTIRHEHNTSRVPRRSSFWSVAC